MGLYGMEGERERYCDDDHVWWCFFSLYVRDYDGDIRTQGKGIKGVLTRKRNLCIIVSTFSSML